MDCTVTIGLPEEWMITERWVSAEAPEKKITQNKYLEMFCWKLRFANCLMHGVLHSSASNTLFLPMSFGWVVSSGSTPTKM